MQQQQQFGPHTNICEHIMFYYETLKPTNLQRATHTQENNVPAFDYVYKKAAIFKTRRPPAQELRKGASTSAETFAQPYGSVPFVLHKLEGHMRHGVVFCCRSMEGTFIIYHF